MTCYETLYTDRSTFDSIVNNKCQVSSLFVSGLNKLLSNLSNQLPTCYASISSDLLIECEENKKK